MARRIVISIRSPWFPFRFARFLRDGRYDVINTEPQLLSGFVVWLAALRRVPVRIVTIHNSIGDAGQSARSRIVRAILSNRLFVWAMRSLITRHATNVIAVSRSALDSVLPGRWRSACRLHHVVYNGTDPRPFPAGGRSRGVREEFGWPAECRDRGERRPLLGPEEPRGHRRDDAAGARARSQVRLLLVGGGVLRGDIERRIERARDTRVSAPSPATGATSRGSWSASDVFFFPSAWEGCRVLRWKRSAAGLPVVTSDIPSMREIASYFPGDITMAPPNDIRRPRRQHHCEPWTNRTMGRGADVSVDSRRRRSRSRRRWRAYRELYGLDSHERVG